MKYFCNKHGEVDGLLLPYSTEILCPLCAQEKYNKEELDEQEQHEKEEIWAARGVQPEYFHKTLDDYKAETDGQKRALSAIKELISTGKGKVVLLGPYGTGKTLLGSIAVMKLGGRITSMYGISTSVHRSYYDKESESEYDVIERLCKTRLLVIDEYGRAFNSESDSRYLSTIISRRQNANLPLILISNLKPRSMVTMYTKKGAPRKNTKGFEDYLTGDVLSRLQDASIIYVDGRDYRKPEKPSPYSNVQLTLGV